MHYTLDSPNGEGLFVWGNVQKRYLCPFQECRSGLLSIGAVGNNVQWWRDPDWFDKAILNCVLFFLYVWQALTFQRKIVVLNEIQENKGGGKPPNITMDKCPKHSKIKKKNQKTTKISCDICSHALMSFSFASLSLDGLVSWAVSVLNCT